jgi:hypothetical protein
MAQEKSSKDAVGGQKEVLAAYKPTHGRTYESNVGEYQRCDDPKSINK